MPERRLDELGQRARVGDVLEQRHALVVLQALGLHRGDGLAAGLLLLGDQHLARVVQGRLDHRDHVEGVARRPGVEHLERGQRERRQRLVERELLGQGHGQADGPPAVGGAHPVHDAALAQRPVDPHRLADQPATAGLGLVVLGEQAAHRGHRVAGAAGEHVEHHRVGHGHARGERLRRGVAEPLEGLLGPVHLAGRGLLADDLLDLLGVVAGLRERRPVLDDVLGREHEHLAERVVPGAARATGDLVELARGQVAHPLPVVLDQ